MSKVIELSQEQKSALITGADLKAHVAKEIVYQVINWQLAKRRSGNHAVKDMSTVHGTNRKPHAQKGGGRARQGSKKAPHMRGGAISMGPVTRDHGYKMNKKVRKLALKIIIADKIKNNAFILLESFPETKRTKDSLNILNNLGLTFEKTLFIVNDHHNNFIKSICNVTNLNTLHANGLNVYSIIQHSTLVLDQNSLKDMIQRVSGGQI